MGLIEQGRKAAERQMGLSLQNIIDDLDAIRIQTTDLETAEQLSYVIGALEGFAS